MGGVFFLSINRVGRLLCFSALLTADSPKAHVLATLKQPSPLGLADTCSLVLSWWGCPFICALRFNQHVWEPLWHLVQTNMSINSFYLGRNLKCGQYYYLLHFIAEDSTAQRGRVTCARPHSGISAQVSWSQTHSHFTTPDLPWSVAVNDTLSIASALHTYTFLFPSRCVPGWSWHPGALPAAAFGHSYNAGDSQKFRGAASRHHFGICGLRGQAA